MDWWTAVIRGDHQRMSALIQSDDTLIDAFHPALGSSPLHVCSREGHEHACGLLIRFGADVNAIDHNARETPLHKAADGNHLRIVQMLMDNGADQYIKNSKGQTIQSQAERFENTTLIHLINSHSTTSHAGKRGCVKVAALLASESKAESSADFEMRKLAHEHRRSKVKLIETEDLMDFYRTTCEELTADLETAKSEIQDLKRQLQIL